MNADKLKDLTIDREYKRRSPGVVWAILLLVLVVIGVAVFVAWPRASDSIRSGMTSSREGGAVGGKVSPDASKAPNGPVPVKPKPGGSILTVSGYIVNRERIELSPRFMGVVKWIGVKKGDAVTNGQIVVLLDDAEYRARLREIEGRLGSARVNLEKAELDYQRMSKLWKEKVEPKQLEDDSRLRVDAARAVIKEIEGARELAQTYLDWTVIRSPIDGVVLEKLVDPNELVVPQSFGGTRGPSTALVAVADPRDLQVEIDMSESHVSKVSLNQPCRVTSEAYPDKVYEGYVAEIAPEATRAKGTLQVKVQVRNPDKFLTPELSAKVDFLAATNTVTEAKTH
jgi:HlyD family secretion protein